MLRRWSLTWCLVLLVAIAPPLSAAAPPSQRLRPQSPRVAGWIADGMARSTTFRALVERIEQGDVIVYLESQPGLRPGVSASVTWMSATPTARFVRASVRPGLSGRDTLAMIAHELQHVVEVIDHPEVRSEQELADLYVRIGHSTGGGGGGLWDTVAALRTGDRVRIELLG